MPINLIRFRQKQITAIETLLPTFFGLKSDSSRVPQ